MSETTTPTGGPLAARIAAAMGEAGEVTKSGRNTEQGYNFASAEAILKAVRGPLFERGIILTPSVDEIAELDITSKGGAKGTRVVLSLTFTFRDGVDELAFKWRGEGQDYGDKAYGKAYTNAVKTFIRTAWLLPTEHDDPEASSPTERASSQANGDTPAWAKPAGRERIAEAVPLADVLGPARTRAIFAAVKGSLGEVPDIVVNIAKLIAGQYAEALTELGYLDDVKAERLVFDEQAAKDAAARKQVEEAQAAAEQPDPTHPDSEAATEADIAGQVERGGGMREGSAHPTSQAPGTVPPPEVPPDSTAHNTEALYRSAGCTCKDPAAAATFELLTSQGKEGEAAQVKPLVDDACPIRGHGIAF